MNIGSDGCKPAGIVHLRAYAPDLNPVEAEPARTALRRIYCPVARIRAAIVQFCTTLK